MLSERPREALVVITFFGVCALTFGYLVARKLRRRRFTASNVAVVGGVKLRGSNSRMLLLAAMIGLPGISFLFLDDLPLLIKICVAVLLGASVLLILGVVTGRVSRRYLRFDPPGLTLGDSRCEYFIPWDEIVDIAELEVHDNPVVGFDVFHSDSIQVTPESARIRVFKLMARNKGFIHRHVMIMPAQFAAQAESLCAAIRNYAQNPAARVELRRNPQLD
jgi:hypothetical protein